MGYAHFKKLFELQMRCLQRLLFWPFLVFCFRALFVSPARIGSGTRQHSTDHIRRDILPSWHSQNPECGMIFIGGIGAQ